MIKNNNLYDGGFTIFPGLPLYAGLLFFAAVDVLWVWVTGIRIDTTTIFPAVKPIIEVFCIILAARFVKQDVIALLPAKHQAVANLVFRKTILILESMLFSGAMLVVLSLYCSLTMSTNLPYTDSQLQSADHFFHLDWKSFFLFIADNPFLAWLLDTSYGALGLVSFVGLMLVLIFCTPKRGEIYNAGYFLTAAICITIGAFFPAQGPVTLLLGGPAPFENLMGFTPRIEYVGHLANLKTANPDALNMLNLPGLVTFPSFHTSAGIVFVWCLRRTYLFWPALLYMAAMIASTPVFGGHYFVDLASGAIIAVVVMLLLERLPRYRDVYKPVMPA